MPVVLVSELTELSQASPRLESGSAAVPGAVVFGSRQQTVPA
jgi:hypothetical protein